MEKVGTHNRIIVSLGDSYSSGEGIEPFYNQNKIGKYSDPDFLAHRSEKCWAGMLTLSGIDGTMAEHRGENWFFVASSGAQIKHMLKSQRKTVRVRKAGNDDSTLHFQTYPAKLLAPQLSIFNELGDKKADYVTLTLGGNDVGFSEMVTQAMVGHTYIGQRFLKMRLASIWNHFFEPGGIRDALIDAYKAIAEAAGPQARIIVAGYPRIFGKSGSRALYSRQSAALLNSAISDFNAQIEYIVSMLRTNGIKIYYVAVEKEFDGHEAYAAYPDNEAAFSEIEYIHRFVVGAGEHDIDAGRPAYSGSMHPTERGAEVYRRCVQRMINKLEAGIDDAVSEPMSEPEIPATAVLTPKNEAQSPEAVKQHPNKVDSADAISTKNEIRAKLTSMLPYVAGGATALLSIGAIVGAAVKKQSDKLTGAAKEAAICPNCRAALPHAAESCPKCGIDIKDKSEAGNDNLE